METIKEIILMDDMIAVYHENDSVGSFYTPVDSDVFDSIIKNIKEQKGTYEVTFKQLSEDFLGMEQKTICHVQIIELNMVSEVVYFMDIDPLSDKKDSGLTMEARCRLKGFTALYDDGRKISYKVER